MKSFVTVILCLFLLAGCTGGGSAPGGTASAGPGVSAGSVSVRLAPALIPRQEAVLAQSGADQLLISLSEPETGRQVHPLVAFDLDRSLALQSFTVSQVVPGTHLLSLQIFDSSGASFLDQEQLVVVNPGQVTQVKFEAGSPIEEPTPIGFVPLERFTVDSNGNQADGAASLDLKNFVSSDGNLIVFGSDATNLVSNDSNGHRDIFLRNRATGQTTRVSLDSSDLEANGDSNQARLSRNQQFVIFTSDADNLVPGDTNGQSDVFVRDLQAGTTERVSLDQFGMEINNDNRVGELSADGNLAFFLSQGLNVVSSPILTNFQLNLYARNRMTGQVELLSISASAGEPDGGSAETMSSGDGNLVAFSSFATNLVTGDLNGVTDIFLRDRVANTTTRINNSTLGEPDGSSNQPFMTPDGNLLVFQSNATNLVAGDTNGATDIFLLDRTANTIERITQGLNGAETDGNSVVPTISDDGRFVAFSSFATNLVDLVDTNNLRDMFIYDRLTGQTARLNLDPQGNPPADGGAAFFGMISGDGRFIVFHSESENLVADDTNGVIDGFVARNPFLP
ncbi:MAG: TolB family protein [Vulcanimicrobiota bacterium]